MSSPGIPSLSMSERTDSDEPAEQPPLDDGDYDAFVLDVEDTADGGTHLDLTITVGQHRGLVLSIASSSSLGDPIDLLGLPATITVTFGSPSVRIDR